MYSWFKLMSPWNVKGPKGSTETATPNVVPGGSPTPTPTPLGTEGPWGASPDAAAACGVAAAGAAAPAAACIAAAAVAAPGAAGVGAKLLRRWKYST